MKTKLKNGWMAVATAPRKTGVYPVVTRKKSNQWQPGYYNKITGIWAEAKYDPSLIVPTLIEVVYWFPLQRP